MWETYLVGKVVHEGTTRLRRGLLLLSLISVVVVVTTGEVLDEIHDQLFF